MKKQNYPLNVMDQKTTPDAEEMIELCRKGWVLINTIVRRGVSDEGGFTDTISYVLVEPALEP